MEFSTRVEAAGTFNLIATDPYRRVLHAPGLKGPAGNFLRLLVLLLSLLLLIPLDAIFTPFLVSSSIPPHFSTRYLTRGPIGWAMFGPSLGSRKSGSSPQPSRQVILAALPLPVVEEWKDVPTVS
ncbi:hypothetical protein F5Y05DRAFT_409348 [Hypoxylon sp. FL0543]|nr:hypothetical protein F5Y05DRAFT_409348 [Hypoxylon sp. FL0543]